jgi:hypothetical protein
VAIHDSIPFVARIDIPKDAIQQYYIHLVQNDKKTKRKRSISNLSQIAGVLKELTGKSKGGELNIVQ